MGQNPPLLGLIRSLGRYWTLISALRPLYVLDFNLAFRLAVVAYNRIAKPTLQLENAER